MICWLCCWAVLACAQTAAEDPAILAARLQSAIDAGDWKTAAELSASLKTAVAEAKNRALSRDSQDRVDTMLGWLPEDMETVLVAQVPFRIEKQNPNVEPDALATARYFTLMMLAPHESLEGSTIRVAILGARRFHEHKSVEGNAAPLGMIAFEGCAAYDFASPVGAGRFSGGSEVALAGQRAWVFVEKEEHGNQEYFLALPKPDLVVACNDRNLLVSVLGRMRNAGGGRALPRSLPEWSQVDRTAPVWAIRHFFADGGEGDPTRAGNAGIGLTMQVGGPGGMVTARWLTGSHENPWKQIADSPEFKAGGRSKELSPGIWELSSSVDSRTGFMTVFAVMAYLGFAVAL